MLRFSILKVYKKLNQNSFLVKKAPTLQTFSFFQFSTTEVDKEKKEKNDSNNPFGWKSLAIFLSMSGSLYYYFLQQKKRILEENQYRDFRGNPDIGGSFELVDLDGSRFTEANLKGKWSLLYFGFTNCPDICPLELNKITRVLSSLNKKRMFKNKILPVFISVDPQRDTPGVLKEYLKDFYPGFVGLTGSEDDIKKMAKTFRVHYSKGPVEEDSNDYIVDHSIITLLFDPNFGFRAFFTIHDSEEKVFNEISNHIRYNVDL